MWVTVRLYSQWKTTMTSGQDVSEFLDTLGLLNHIFPNVFKKIENESKKNVLVLRHPEDEAISLFAGLLTNPDVTLHPHLYYFM